MANSELATTILDASPGPRTRGPSSVPASSFPRRLTASVWFPVALRCAAMAALIFALAGIGAASLIWGGGHPFSKSSADPALGAAAWIAPVSSADPENDHVAQPSDGGAAPDAAPALTADGKVILNAASAAELRRLPGIGKKRAEKILALRQKLKRFRRVSDLLRVRGLGARALRRIAPLVVLDPPAPPPSTNDGGS